MKMKLWPKTKAGKWAAILNLLFILCVDFSVFHDRNYYVRAQ